MTDPVRTARLDQALAALDELIDGFVNDVRTVLVTSPSPERGEVWLALSTSLHTSPHPSVCDLCAGALVRLARRGDGTADV